MKRQINSARMLATTASIVALMVFATPAFSQAVNNNGGKGVGASIGGANGVNAAVGVNSSNGVGANANVGIGGSNGVNGNGSVQIGGSQSTNANGSVSIGGSNGVNGDVDATIGGGGVGADVDVSVGGIGSDVDVGIGNVPGTGSDDDDDDTDTANNPPGVDNPPGGSIVTDNPGIANMLASMSDNERRILKKKCADVLRSPASYTRDQVTVCRVLAQLAAR